MKNKCGQILKLKESSSVCKMCVIRSKKKALDQKSNKQILGFRDELL